MVEAALPLAEIVKAEFVDGGRANRPGVAQVPLLVAGLEDRAETRNVGTRGLEIRERTGRVIIVEIVVGRELLCVGDLLVEPNGELVLAFVVIRNAVGLAGASRCDIPVVESHCGWIEALLRNDVPGEHGRVRVAPRRNRIPEVGAALV